MASTASLSPTTSSARTTGPTKRSTTPRRRLRFLVPVVLLVLVGAVLATVLTAAPRTPPTLLGASATVDGGLARIQGVIPTEVDSWTPPTPSAALAVPTGDGVHRVRILVELTALEGEGLSFDPREYSVSGLGDASWAPVWFSPEPAEVRQGEVVDAMLVFELPDRAIDLTLEVPGSSGLSLGAGHHRSGN